MAKVPKTGLAKRIREVLKEKFRKKPFVPREVSEALGIPPGKEREKVATALRKDFCSRGEVVKLPNGKYRYVGGELKHGAPKVRFKLRIAKAIYYYRVFTLAEIAALADANYWTVRKFVARNKEWFKEIGKKKLAGEMHKVYQLLKDDEFYQKFVLKEEEKWQN